MTTDQKINELKRELKQLSEKHESLSQNIKNLSESISFVKSEQLNKPTRYYPNGAYMDEPENYIRCYYITTFNHEVKDFTWHFEHVENNITDMNCFPTKEAAEKELNRQRLTAKMYRDMRDERINGDWMADWESTENKCYPYLENRRSGLVMGSYSISYVKSPNPFYYKRDTFIEDLKAMGWTEEELKIVWFNN